MLGVAILDNSAFLVSHFDNGIAYFQKFRMSIAFIHMTISLTFFLWKGGGERIPTMLYFKELLGAHKNHSFSRITKFFGER